MKDGKPTYNIGRPRGSCADDPGFGRWMLDKDFTENTKMVLRSILTRPRQIAFRLTVPTTEYNELSAYTAN